jgi:riboflavin kinase / FMN adenylyltransferase
MSNVTPLLETSPLIVARWPDLAAARDALAGAVVAIGNFDGVHLGHRAVLAEAKTLGESIGRSCGLLTFEPHPRRVFQPDTPLFRLTYAPEKARLVAQFGFGKTVALDFEPGLSGLSADAFAADVLVRGLQIGGAVVGPDFRFGKGRSGDAALLVTLLAQHQRPAKVIDVTQSDGQNISSSAIRALLEEGRVAKANAMLGYRWSVHGIVQHGDKRGRLLGFPTANLHLDVGCRLKHGIYAVCVRVPGGSDSADSVQEGVASFGQRPTFDGGAPKLEVFLFDFSGDLYDRDIDVEFVDFIRPELKFSSVDDLILQMKLDTDEAKIMLKNYM